MNKGERAFEQAAAGSSGVPWLRKARSILDSARHRANEARGFRVFIYIRAYYPADSTDLSFGHWAVVAKDEDEAYLEGGRLANCVMRIPPGARLINDYAAPMTAKALRGYVVDLAARINAGEA